jgi:hypothetical protein
MDQTAESYAATLEGGNSMRLINRNDALALLRPCFLN